jgi:uncharacterized protein with HEPN domain
MKESSENDLVRVRHMLDAARTARAFVEGQNRESLDSNLMLTFAIVRAIEIIGEAASHITADFRDANPLIPWKAIKGMRNWVVHAYFDVDLDDVWSTVENDLPPLISQLEKIIPAES